MSDTWTPQVGMDGRTRDGRRVTNLSCETSPERRVYPWQGYVEGWRWHFWTEDGRIGPNANPLDLVGPWAEPAPGAAPPKSERETVAPVVGKKYVTRDGRQVVNIQRKPSGGFLGDILPDEAGGIICHNVDWTEDGQAAHFWSNCIDLVAEYVEPAMPEIAISFEEFERHAFTNRAAKPDLVNHPPHYTYGKYEVIDVLEDWFPDDPHLWQVGKYIARAGRKGDILEDLRKAEFYLKRRIGMIEREQRG